MKYTWLPQTICSYSSLWTKHDTLKPRYNTVTQLYYDIEAFPFRINHWSLLDSSHKRPVMPSFDVCFDVRRRQAFEQTVELSLSSDAMMLLWCHSHATCRSLLTKYLTVQSRYNAVKFTQTTLKHLGLTIANIAIHWINEYYITLQMSTVNISEKIAAILLNNVAITLASYPITLYVYWPAVPTQIAKFMGPTWGPPGSCLIQMGPMLAPWTLLSGHSSCHAAVGLCRFYLLWMLRMSGCCVCVKYICNSWVHWYWLYPYTNLCLWPPACYAM